MSIQMMKKIIKTKNRSLDQEIVINLIRTFKIKIQNEKFFFLIVKWSGCWNRTGVSNLLAFLMKMEPKIDQNDYFSEILKTSSRFKI